MTSHEVNLLEPWPLLHTWPLPNLLASPDATKNGQGTGPDQVRSLVQLGAWECDLKDNSLRWTAGVFDLFGLPRDTAVTRDDAVARYCEDSRETMELLRAYAIKHRRGFTMDARLARFDGQSRWMRLTTALASENGRPRRLYGTKQDITCEYDRRTRLKEDPEVDSLTALATRPAFEAGFLHGGAKQCREVGLLLVIDFEDVERIGTHFAPEARDACLYALASRIAYRAPEALMVARISDHAFAVVLPPSSARHALAKKVQRLLRDLRQPIYWQGYLLRLVPSAGVARPPEACTFDPEELFSVACVKANMARRKLVWIGTGQESFSLSSVGD